MYDLGKNAEEVLKMYCAVSNFQNSLNSFDCFSCACIMVLIETKGIYVTHCLLPFFAELQQSDFVLREKRKFLENKPGIELNINIKLNLKKMQKWN